MTHLLFCHPQPGHWGPCLWFAAPSFFWAFPQSVPFFHISEVQAYKGRWDQRQTCRAGGRVNLGSGGIISGGSQWGAGSLSPGTLYSRPRTFICRGPQVLQPRPAPPASLNPHTQLATLRSFHPLLTTLGHARVSRAGQSAVPTSSARAPPLSSGSRRRRGAAVGAPARLQALRPLPPGPRRRAAWNGR